MRVLLVHPPLNASAEVTPPLGLCTLAAWLLSCRHQVRILDLDLEIKGRSDGPTAYLTVLDHVLRDFSPDAVGITSMYNNSLHAERLVRAVKAFDPAIVTIAGGSHFGALASPALRRIAELDYAIEGEGEHGFSALLTALESNLSVAEIPRLHYRSNGELRANKADGLMELAELPVIWSALGESIDLRRYADTVSDGSNPRTIYVEAGRGCPFACTFCATAPFWERKYRVKPTTSIIDEMRFLYEQFGYDGFMLVHDLLTVDKRFINEFCDAMIDSRLPVRWMANHRTDIDLHGLLPKMKSAGCWAMFFGVESASARLQKEMRKGLKRDGVIGTIRGLSELGIDSTCSFVMGFPDESAEELSETVKMGAELKLFGAGLIQFHRLRTWPPAPLSRNSLPAKFDKDSMRLEYPFLDVPDEDIAILSKDREFFAGYFAPYTTAGNFSQMADVELFFTQAVAAAPLTIAILGRLMGANLIPSFFNTVTSIGCITRSDIEADTGSMIPIWRLLRPFIEEWIANYSWGEPWHKNLLRGVIEYEDYRLKFVNNQSLSDKDAKVVEDNCAAFVSNVDIAALFDAMQAGTTLTGTLVTESAIVLFRSEVNTYQAYMTDTLHLTELVQSGALRQALSPSSLSLKTN
jgi:radical SAM superfamily enzyme YgiQ (UPF0313 family)